MKVLIVNNIPREGPGILKDVLDKNSIRYDTHEFGVGKKVPNLKEYGAVFIFGGPDSANDNSKKMIEEIYYVKDLLSSNVPYFGICLGLQVMVKALGGTVKKNPIKEVGWRDPDNEIFKVQLTNKGINDAIFKDLDFEFIVFQLHGETVELTSDMSLLGTGKYCTNQIVKIGNNAYGFQSHIELSNDMFYNWIIEDDDLKKSDYTSLDFDYNNLKIKYEEIGNRIFKNFLKIANFDIK